MPESWKALQEGLTWYTLLLIAGIALSALIWWRITRDPSRRDSRLIWIYLAGLFGALIGAKIAFLIAAGWMYRNDPIALLSGKSITGGILGGYIAVEWAKRQTGYARTTGDIFAITAPLGLAIGRIGCLVQGCCGGIECERHWWTVLDSHGVPRWPSQVAEIIFHIGFLIWALLAARFKLAHENRFHVFLIAYGLVRFGLEFVRTEPRLFGAFTGYHFIALTMLIFGLVRYRQRSRKLQVSM